VDRAWTDYKCDKQSITYKSLSSCKAYRAVLIYFFSPQPDTSLHYDTTDIGLQQCACLHPSYRLLIVPTHRGMARLS